jgi:ribosomal protein L37AE/L43A
MTLRLIKTTTGQPGAPKQCSYCGGTGFIRSRIGWECTTCRKYIPINLDAPNATEKLKRDLEVLQELGKEFRKAVFELEEIVKK